LQFYKAPNPSPWQVFDLSAAAGGQLISGDPAILATGATVQIFGRGPGGQLLQFYKAPNPSPWQVFELPPV
jgi:hypothetical protein